MAERLLSAMIDPPGLFDTPETWERYLIDLEKMDEFWGKESLLAEARQMIEEKRHERIRA